MLLCIHSYPGANLTVLRHFPYYEKSGAKKIIGIGTSDRRCQWPHNVDYVNIGENSYLAGDVLPLRLLDTMAFCLQQPFDHFCIVEYDCLFFKPMPAFSGLASFRAGGKTHGSIAEAFFHCPWAFDRETGEKFLERGRQLIRKLNPSMPECSPDVFFGWVAEDAGLPVSQPWEGFSRNSLDCDGDLDRARMAYRSGATAIHGVKHIHELEYIIS